MTPRFKETAFLIGFLIYLLVLYLDSAHLSAGSRAFPMAVIGISVIVVALKLLTFKFPRLKFLDPSGNVAKDVLSGAGKPTDALDDEEPPAAADERPWSRAITISWIMVWLITFAGGIYLIGFLPTLAVWLFIFMVGISKLKPARALFLSVCTFVVLYVSFVTLLGTNFPPGILF